MRFFNKEEIIAILIIFFVLTIVSIPNFSLSIKRARDTSRQDDMGSLQGALNNYFKDFGQFPKSTPDGKIIGCVAPGTTPSRDSKGNLVVTYIPCEWGRDGLLNPVDANASNYVNPLPNDPQAQAGMHYVYLSDGTRYQILGSFEDSGNAEYNKAVLARGISCGARLCNFGRGYATTPVNISIEQYEKTLQK